MLQDMVHPPEQLSNEDFASPISADQIFKICEAELFQEPFQTSEVTSNSSTEENTSYASNFSVPDSGDYYNTGQDNKIAAATITTTAASTTTSNTATSTTNTANNNGDNNLYMFFDPHDGIIENNNNNDISGSINLATSPQFSMPQYVPNQQENYDFSSVGPGVLPGTDVIEGISPYPTENIGPFVAPTIQPVFEDDCLSSVPSFLPINSSSPPVGSFLGPGIGSLVPPGNLSSAFSAESSGNYTANFLLGNELQSQEYQGDNGVTFYPESLQQVFNAPELQAFGSESHQQMIGGGGSAAPLSSEITSLDDPTLKVGKLSTEQRKEKISRYLKKRKERNFNKKIKYACRKTLADSRPRVRGRFAKNDDFGEAIKNSYSHHEEEDDDEVRYIFNTHGGQSSGLVYF